MLCIVDYIRARNGRFHRMCCTLGTDTSLFAGDAQVARTSYSNFGTLSFLYDAIQIHSWRKPSRVRSMLIRFSSLLIRFLYAAALLGPPLPGPYLRTYYVDACTAVSGCFGSIRYYVFLFLWSKFLFSRRPRTFLWLN